MYRRRRYHRNPYLRLFLILVIIFFLSIGLVFYMDNKVRPYVRAMSETRAQSIATYAVSNAVTEEMASANISYEDLVLFEKSADGKINALTTNVIKINQLKASLAEKIQNYLSEMDQTVLIVPLGNIINGQILSGRGPKLYFKMIPVGSVHTDIENIFTTAGINQTRHQIMLKVDVHISVLLPISSVNASVGTSFCIAETIIVGNVPNSYTNVNGDESSVIGKINDYATP